MKITVYSAKGSAGKTPIATNIALDKGYAIGTNEQFHVFDSFIEEEKLLAIPLEESFPEIPNGIDIVFDLAGSIGIHSKSISSSIMQSNIVLIPIYNEIKSLSAGINSINEVMKLNKNIIVVATKLQKQRGEIFTDWTKSSDYINISRAVKENISDEILVLPLKFSKVFDTIFEKEKSINQLMESDKLANYSYRDVGKQFNKIYEKIGI